MIFHRTIVSKPAVRWMRFACVAMICIAACGPLAVAQKSIPEPIEWSWYARPEHPDAKLPNVLLLGDSICRNYAPRVTENLSGVANVYLFATSASIGDPRLPAQISEFKKLEGVSFAVVHMNNGMHGWQYSEAEYARGFPDFLRAVATISHGRARLVWATTTPVKADKPDGASNARIVARNTIALDALRGKDILVDDQHALMLRHSDLYADLVHFNASGSQLQGDQVAQIILAALKAAR